MFLAIKAFSTANSLKALFVGNFNTGGWLRGLPLVGVLLCFTACSMVSLGYSVVSPYMVYELNRHFDLDDDQTRLAKKTFGDLVDWHRQEEAPKLVALIGQLRTKIKTEVTPSDVNDVRQQMFARWEPVAKKLAVPTAELALSLQPYQIKRMKERFDASNADTRKKFLQADAGKRHTERVKRIRERSEQIYGSLTDAQVKEIQAYAATLSFDNSAWFEERLNRQKVLISTLERIRSERPPLAKASVDMEKFWVNYWKVQDPKNQANFDAGMRANDLITAKIANMTTPEQRAKADSRLQGWMNDLRGAN